MKRRDFLASAAFLSLLSADALAAKTTTKKPPIKKAKAPAAKPKKKTVTSGKPTSRQVAAPAVASESLIDSPPDGTSASRLPPVRAAELPTEWRTFEIVTSISLPERPSTVKLWLPMPYSQDTLYQRTLGHRWNGNMSTAGMRRQPDGELELFQCEWPAEKPATLQLTSVVSTADRHFDVTRRTIAPERSDILRHNLQSTPLIPTDGLARQLGERIIGRIKDPVAQVKAIYDWVTEQAIYDPTLPGCGKGDVQRQLISGQYGGRSADINGLFVSLCRAMGIPARCVYGLRIGSSRLFPSLGLRNNDASQAQHVRAEFYVPGYGWIPADPSDVRRAVAYEALSIQDSRLAALQRVLFGIWEMNWLAFNVGSQVTLPDDSQPQPFFIHPKLSLDGQSHPTDGRITITARQVFL